jgi:hypothetical protein
MGDLLTLEGHYVRFSRELEDDVKYLSYGTTSATSILNLRKRMIAQIQGEWMESMECAGEILPQLAVDKVQLDQPSGYSVFVDAYLPQGADPVNFLQDIIFDKGGMSGEFRVLPSSGEDE